jgi:putative acetyltransferase
MTADVAIAPETPADREGIFETVRLAFGRDDEAKLVDRLRAAGLCVVAMVAREEGQAVGYALFSRLPLFSAQGRMDALALAPVAVRPEAQKRGLGGALIRDGIALCRRTGETAVLVLGHEEYYPRFGFSPELAKNLRAPFSGPAWMALELRPGALAGLEAEVRYPVEWGL